LQRWAREHAEDAPWPLVDAAIRRLADRSPQLWALHSVVANMPPPEVAAAFSVELSSLCPNVAAGVASYEDASSEGGASDGGSPWLLAGRHRHRTAAHPPADSRAAAAPPAGGRGRAKVNLGTSKDKNKKNLGTTKQGAVRAPRAAAPARAPATTADGLAHTSGAQRTRPVLGRAAKSQPAWPFYLVPPNPAPAGAPGGGRRTNERR
jgi:hypothetical protein